jgi:hypothetical protein
MSSIGAWAPLTVVFAAGVAIGRGRIGHGIGIAPCAILLAAPKAVAVAIRSLQHAYGARNASIAVQRFPSRLSSARQS